MLLRAIPFPLLSERKTGGRMRYGKGPGHRLGFGHEECLFGVDGGIRPPAGEVLGQSKDGVLAGRGGNLEVSAFARDESGQILCGCCQVACLCPDHAAVEQQAAVVLGDLRGLVGQPGLGHASQGRQRAVGVSGGLGEQPDGETASRAGGYGVDDGMQSGHGFRAVRPQEQSRPQPATGEQAQSRISGGVPGASEEPLGFVRFFSRGSGKEAQDGISAWAWSTLADGTTQDLGSAIQAPVYQADSGGEEEKVVLLTAR